jgi:hypothetical protein
MGGKIASPRLENMTRSMHFRKIFGVFFVL